MAMDVGIQINRLRKLRRMSLAALAKTSGVQIATISRIENGKMTGTLESHLNIAKALGVGIAELYQSVEQEELSGHSEGLELKPLVSADSKTTKDILARQISTKRMLPLLVKIDSKGISSEESLPFGSERFVFVLEGTIDVKIKDQKVRLSPNMSLYFNAYQPHSFENAGHGAAKFLSITTPVTI